MLEAGDKALFSAAAIALTLFAFLPYIVSIHRGRTRPHLFSWLIWATTTLTVFLAQWLEGGGAGAWPTGVSGLITLYIAALAWLRRADLQITRSDRLFLVMALGAWPLWWLTAEPLWAVVLLTTVDGLGFGPTLRKAYREPHEENAGFFALFVLRNLLAMAALQHYSLTTLLFPAVVSLLCLAVIGVLLRRRRLAGSSSAGQ